MQMICAFPLMLLMGKSLRYRVRMFMQCITRLSAVFCNYFSHIFHEICKCRWNLFIQFVICLPFLPTAVFSHLQMPMEEEIPAVRVNCRTPDLMIFQIYEPRVRALLRVPTGRSFMLFSEDPDTGLAIRNCSANYTITSTAPGWSTSFTFLNYAPNTSCIVRSFLVDKDRIAHHTYVADIFLKVLASDDGVGVGRRGRIRLTCTMLAMQKVHTKMTELRSDVSLPVQGSVLPSGAISPTETVETISEKLEGALMLRFFKRIPSSLVPVPAISISEGEEVYLVAALKTGSPFTVLRPINCTIRSMVSGSFRKDASAGIGEFIHGASRAGILVRESIILENGCQSEHAQWFMPTRPAGTTEQRMYFTRFAAPSFTGSLRLNARCSINLCSAANARSCLEQPQRMGPTCFTETVDVPQFQFRLETFTNITQYRPQPNVTAPPSLRAHNGHMGIPPFTDRHIEQP
ncbi:uncharacterized protein LOC129594899 [Paramacrobiotus metropolitanus]|uniref:uncharacterized protein LOC129594899 n=1 Tax=Paramacrobiotus metropolitanus TaxID=2943436 RepID=UPI00244620DE|nr:uncharacterized protein LOC129594899 [Paramacrobiotus metropolitanus]